MMNKKLTTTLLGLLLAVGWTSSASAQLLPGVQERHQEMRVAVKATKAVKHAGTPEKATANQQHGSLKANAPKRTQNYDLNATVVHPKSWYQALPNVTWSGGSQNITEPFTTAKGMMALLKRIYTDSEIPGAKYSAPRNCDIPYQTIQHGWDIVGTNYLDDAIVKVNSNTLIIYQITIEDVEGNVLRTLTPDNTTFPSTSWSTYTSSYYSSYWYAKSSSGAAVSIPASWLQNTSGGANITVDCVSTNQYYSTTSQDTLSIGNQTYDYAKDGIPYSSQHSYTLQYTFPGTITPPDENGYTVCLVKLYDGINMTDADMAPEYTATTEELENYFTTYVKEIQLLTDGLRVASGTSNAGTVFAYTGDLNRFFFLSKGKMFYYSSIQGLDYDRAPFYSMYEEFSANDVSDQTGFTDFYEKMKQGTTYDIKHDCMGVNYRQHYFSMSGKQGTTENRVNSLVFYIPDQRGILNSDWREYDPNHLPTVGMYMVDLYAEVEPSTTPDYYTVTVHWHDNLDDLTHTENIPQTYTLYETKINPETGQVETHVVYTGMDTSWNFDYPVGDPSYYDISYYVVATPVGEGGTTENPTYTNPDFFAKSNTDDVTIPGKSDFLGLQWQRYESDYVILNPQEQVNYYRNWLAPHALSVQGEAGITAGNVGTNGRTLTLYRGETPIMYLDLIMDGNKAYYRIRHINKEANQQVEDGYDPETGELKPNTNN